MLNGRDSDYELSPPLEGTREEGWWKKETKKKARWRAKYRRGQRWKGPTQLLIAT